MNAKKEEAKIVSQARVGKSCPSDRLKEGKIDKDNLLYRSEKVDLVVLDDKGRPVNAWVHLGIDPYSEMIVDIEVTTKPVRQKKINKRPLPIERQV